MLTRVSSLQEYNLWTQLYHKNSRNERFVLTPSQEKFFHLIYSDTYRRVAIKTTTQFGKSDTTSMALIHRAIDERIKICIVSPSMKQSEIIMGFVIQHFFDHPDIRGMLNVDDSLEKLKRERSKQRITLKNDSEIATLTADARTLSQEGKGLMGFGCIPEGYKVATDKGYIEIKELVNNKSTKKVWSFNHATNKRELRNIVDYQTNKIEDRYLLELTTSTGKKFQCTNDHPVWIKHRGYISADKIKLGDICMGLGLNDIIVSSTIKSWLLNAKYAVKNFINVRVTSRELITNSVVEHVVAYLIKAKAIRCIKTMLKDVCNAAKSIKIKPRGFVQENVLGLSSKESCNTGKQSVEKSIIVGRGIKSVIRGFICGSLDTEVDHQRVNIVKRLVYQGVKSIGQARMGYISAIYLNGLDYAHNVIKNTTLQEEKVVKIKKITPKSNLVYNLNVEHNHNYFIEGLLLHNSDMVIIDESALIPDDMYSKILRMVGGTNGKIVQLGNPFPSLHFQNAFNDPTYTTMSVDYKQAVIEGRLTSQFVEEARRTITAFDFGIFYEVNFPLTEGRVFRNVTNIMSLRPQEPIVGHLYVMGVDLAKVQDYTVIAVYDRKTNNQVYQERFNELDWNLVKEKIKAISKKYNNALCCLDVTGLGNPIFDDLTRAGVPVEPYHFTSETKKDLIEKMVLFTEQKNVTLLANDDSRDEFLQFTYSISSNGRIRYEAPQGLHDDIVIANSLAVYLLQPLIKPEVKKEMTEIERDYAELKKAYELRQRGNQIIDTDIEAV